VIPSPHRKNYFSRALSKVWSYGFAGITLSAGSWLEGNSQVTTLPSLPSVQAAPISASVLMGKEGNPPIAVVSPAREAPPSSPLEQPKTTQPMERTLIILKPDCLENRHVGEVIARFEEAGLCLIACKMKEVPDAVWLEHYAHLAHLPFFQEIVEFMSAGPVIILILEGPDAIACVRTLLGDTDSRIAAPGTIRRTWGTDKMRNIAHASDSLQTAAAEIRRFFKPDEIFALQPRGAHSDICVLESEIER
jgi:nucleoside-diphosphate kinase